MSPIERLPTEIVQFIAELCTWDSAPPENGFPSEIDVRRYKYNGTWRLQSYARYHAAFARTSRHFHDMLNERLYARNLSRDPNSCSCLRWALKHNRLETIKRAHQYGADLNSYGPEPHITTLPDDRGSVDQYVKVNGVLVPYSCVRGKCHGSPLYDAVSSGFKEIVEYLLEAKVKVEEEVPGKEGYPITESESEDIALMLVRHGAYLSREGFSALPLAYRCGFHDVVEILLQRNDPVSLAGKLLVGAASDSLELVTQALEHPDVDVNTKYYDTEDTALHMAINSAQGELKVIEFLLGQPRIRISIPGAWGHLPLHLAARNERMDIVRLLAKMPDFDVNCRSVGSQTAIDMAARATTIEPFSYFLEHPSQRFEQSAPWRSEDLRRLLQIISRSSDDVLAKDFVQLLLDSGTHLSKNEIEPDCALIDTIQRGNLLTASKLLPLIPKSHFDGYYGRVDRPEKPSLLHLALTLQHPHLTTFVGELIARGVDIQLPRNSYRGVRSKREFRASPLFFATAFARNTDCMKMLLEAGADANSTVRVRVARGISRQSFRKMSLLSALFSYAWGKRQSIVEYPIHYPGQNEIPITEGMSELAGPILMLLQHDATLDMVENGPSALSLVCTEAVESSNLSLLKWLTDNATASNVSTEHVDSLLSAFPLVEDEPVQRGLHNILQGFKEGLLRGGIQYWD